jgi:hypothetical protein
MSNTTRVPQGAITADTPTPPPQLVGAFDAHAAARYLGMKDGRYMDDLPIPRVDLAKPGAKRPRWVWRKVDLDVFLASRVVQPGHPSRWSGLLNS